MAKRKRKSKKAKKQHAKNLAIAGIVLVIAFAYYFFVMEPPLKICEDIECFVEKANDCGYVTLELDQNRGLYYFGAENCVFTKIILALDGESEEMMELLQQKRLDCPYEKGGFNEEWITSDINGLEDCSGELKDVLMELLAFI